MARIAPWRVRHEAADGVVRTDTIYAVGPRAAGDVWLAREGGLQRERDRAAEWAAPGRMLVRRLRAWRAVSVDGGRWIFHATGPAVAAAKAATRAGAAESVAQEVPDLAMLVTLPAQEVARQVSFVWGTGKGFEEWMRRWIPGASQKWLDGRRGLTGTAARALAFMLWLAQEHPEMAPDEPPLDRRQSGTAAPAARRSAEEAMRVHGGNVERSAISDCLKAGLRRINRLLTEEQLLALRELERQYGWRGLSVSELLLLWEQGHTALEDHRLERGIRLGYGLRR